MKFENTEYLGGSIIYCIIF